MESNVAAVSSFATFRYLRVGIVFDVVAPWLGLWAICSKLCKAVFLKKQKKNVNGRQMKATLLRL